MHQIINLINVNILKKKNFTKNLFLRLPIIFQRLKSVKNMLLQISAIESEKFYRHDHFT